MQIDSIRIVRVGMPLVYPFRTAFGNVELIESTLVRLTSGEKTGWGESACWGMPAYSAECAATQFLISRDFIAPLLLDQWIATGAELQEKLNGIKGNYFAKAAFDLAWWDLHANVVQQPLWKILGGKSDTIDAGADFGVMENVQTLIKTINEACNQGYKRVKLKYRPGWDLDMIKQVRDKFPDLPVHIDCNSCYSLQDMDMFKELDNYRLTMIEQPLAHDDLIDHAVLQQELQTPVCLDESIVSAHKARKAIEVGACRWVNIKLGRVGGITNALSVNKVCEERHIPCWVGGMLESAIGSSHNIAFAALPNIQYPSDIFPTSRFYAKDLGCRPIEHEGLSQFRASRLPGIGVTPDEAMIAKWSIEECCFS